MSVAVALKVNDGLVIAADSATTILAPGGPSDPRVVYNVYNHASKVFNLYKSLPVGGMSWGLGAIGVSSVSSLAKDLRERLMGTHGADNRFKINPSHYSVREIADHAAVFLREVYDREFGSTRSNKQLDMGFFIGGYSKGGDSRDARTPEQYLIEFDSDGRCEGPKPWAPGNDASLAAFAMEEAIHRLVFGASNNLHAIVEEMGVKAELVDDFVAKIERDMKAELISPAMPIQDAIDLVEFLVNTEITFNRFLPGSSLVGGPAEIAAITKHEGFKWIRRRHYYNFTLNPRPEATIGDEKS